MMCTTYNVSCIKFGVILSRLPFSSAEQNGKLVTYSGAVMDISKSDPVFYRPQIGSGSDVYSDLLLTQRHDSKTLNGQSRNYSPPHLQSNIHSKTCSVYYVLET